MRLIYMTPDDPRPELDPSGSWEIYRYHDEEYQREMWRAPVSPYFHVIDPYGRIAEKGVANAPDHLDRLVSPSVSFSSVPISEGGGFDV